MPMGDAYGVSSVLSSAPEPPKNVEYRSLSPAALSFTRKLSGGPAGVAHPVGFVAGGQIAVRKPGEFGSAGLQAGSRGSHALTKKLAGRVALHSPSVPHVGS